MPGAIVAAYLEDRTVKGKLSLAAELDAMSTRALLSSELLERLASLPQDGSCSLLVTELIERLPQFSEMDKERLLALLCLWATAEEPPSRRRHTADRVLLRVLHELPGEDDVDDILLACLYDGRPIRRSAVYRRLLAHGAGPRVRAYLVDELDPRDVDLVKVVCRDAELIGHIGWEEALLWAPSSYWRKIVISTCFSATDPVEQFGPLVADYPLELTWAIHDSNDRRFVPVVRRILAKHGGDPYLMHRILQCAGRLGEPSLIEDVCAAAKLLTAPAPDTDRAVAAASAHRKGLR